MALGTARHWDLSRLREIYQYRELARNLVMRDLKVRYRHSVLGIIWSLLNPLLMTLVFTILFKVLLPDPTPRFPLFIMAALLPWNYCATSVSGSVNSVVGSANLVNKVYFPRELLPISVVLSNLANFILALPVLFLFMALYSVPFTPLLAYLPLLILIETIFLVGLSFILACVNVYFRDTQVIVEVLLTAWFLLTPVFYPIERLPSNWHGQNIHAWMYWLNPMASLVSNYRLILDYASPPALDFLARTALTAVGVLVVGYVIFGRYRHTMCEEL